MKTGYEIRAETEAGRIDYFCHSKSPKKAAKLAKDMAKTHKDHFVFVQWFRSSDGQVGYLNPGEHHEPTGKRWTNA